MPAFFRLRLQPIGVDSTYRLIFGERRLKAFQLLGRDTIPAVVIDVDSLLGEHDENIVRKEFTVSERVAIGQSLEARMGERRGGDTSTGVQRNVQNFAQCKGKKTVEMAADKSGFDNQETYRQAKQVVEHGAPDLVAAMDAGEVSVSPNRLFHRLTCCWLIPVTSSASSLPKTPICVFASVY